MAIWIPYLGNSKHILDFHLPVFGIKLIPEIRTISECFTSIHFPSNNTVTKMAYASHSACTGVTLVKQRVVSSCPPFSELPGIQTRNQ